MSKMNIAYSALENIHGYERNARNHPESQIKQIIKSITEFGFNNPILIDENNEIIAGHGRFMAAQVMNLKTVPTLLNLMAKVQSFYLFFKRILVINNYRKKRLTNTIFLSNI